MNNQYTIFQGDNLEILKNIADNSIDSVVTDPPYGLGKEPDPVQVIKNSQENPVCLRRG